MTQERFKELFRELVKDIPGSNYDKQYPALSDDEILKLVAEVLEEYHS